MSKNKIKEIHVLMQECTEHLQYLGYSEACISLHQKKWAGYLLPYLKEKGITNYFSDIGEKYLDSVLPTLTPFPKRVLIRSVRVLSAYLETGAIPKRIVHLVEYPLSGEIGKAASAFLEDLIERRRSELTITKHRRILSYFTLYLETKSKVKIADIEDSDILSFISTSINLKDRYYTMRLFCRFLYAQKYTGIDLGYIIEHNRFPKREKLPSIYNADEVRQIETSVEQSGPVGKRDYAMLLLASRLGLRASDIGKLKFPNIDWDNNKIMFTQYKTGKPVELPLLTEVGEAIINYLQYARPVSDFQEVFLSARPPYCPMGRHAVNSAISKIMRESGVDISQRKFGPHSMRHSLASRLLANGVLLPVISESLGHSNTVSTMEYLRVDISSLSKCPLDVPLVAPDFYEQKGGLFYV
jgi:integrase